MSNISFAFARNESEGTIKYFSLAYPIIDALDNGKRILIDELDSKLHPLLVKRIVALFNDEKTVGQAMNTMTLVKKAINIRETDQKRKKFYDQCWVVVIFNIEEKLFF